MNDITPLLVRLLAVLSLMLATTACAEKNTSEVAMDNTLRTLSQGQITGITDPQTASQQWLGIPFAQPPVGDLRWKAPRAPAPWSGVLEAVTYGASCTQSVPNFDNNLYAGAAYSHTTYSGSEDCLYLNIWSPEYTEQTIPKGEKRLPVMVWIHGGGNTAGNGELFGGKLASTQKVIVVSMNYRLGPFGWLSHPALRQTADNPDDASGNFGTLDIIQSLQWVQQNIAAFGGDPDRVTLFGISAGAWNIHSLLHSPKARGLFHGAIAQSGWPTTTSLPLAEHFKDDDQAGHPQSSNELLLQLLMQDNAELDRQGAHEKLATMAANDIVSYLKSKSYQALEAAYDEISQRDSAGFFKQEQELTVKLSSYLPKSNMSVPKLFEDGYVISTELYPVSLIAGSNRDEATIFQVLSNDYLAVNDGKRSIINPQRYQLVNKYISQLWNVADANDIARDQSPQQQAQTFVYRFDWDDLPAVGGEDLKGIYGAHHSLDVVFILGMETLFIADAHPGESYQTLSQAMMSYWAQFAYQGNPDKGRDGKLPEWQPWLAPEADQETMIIFDKLESEGIRLSSQTLTKEKVLTALANDKQLKDKTLRCQLFRDLLNFPLTYFTYTDYLSLDKNRDCDI